VPSRVDYGLYLVSDRPLARGRPLQEVIASAVAGGCTVVQVREKEVSTREFLALAGAVRSVLASGFVPLIINDRIDVALACGADGVHLGQDDMPCAEARRFLDDRMIVGVSVSTVDEARRAEAEGADYLGVGPIFATPTKTDTPTPTGLAGLAAIRRATTLPLVGIGGVKATNARDVIAAGADGVAVVSAIMSAEDPERAARDLLAAVRAGQSTT
jgi:thiamine-phosphate pyrophosphorylase